MKFVRGQFWRWLLIAGSAATLMSGCDDKTDPDALSAADLKSPSSLWFMDKGSGKVVLKWFTSNPESDFEGYNVYGAKITADALNATDGITVGEPIKLLDADGEPVAAVKDTVMPLFDYSDANLDNALPGVTTAIQIDETKFATLPIHQRNPEDPEDPLLPTCSPSNGVCSVVTAAITDPSTITSNGVVSYDLEESGITLEIGTSYCFFVLSVQSEGAEVSEGSSDVHCVVRRHKTTGSWESSATHIVDMRTLLTNCNAGDCTVTTTAGNTGNNLFLENLGGVLNLSNGSTRSYMVRRLGVVPGGFDEFIGKAPKLVYDSTKLEMGGGYSLPGQSVAIEPKGMYAIAVGDEDVTKTTDWHYHYMWISNDSVAGGTKIEFEFRLAKNVNQL